MIRLTAIRKYSLPITVLPKALLKLTEEEYQSARRTAVRKKKKRLLPGASPLVYARLLMEDVRG